MVGGSLESLMPLDGQRLKIHSGVFQHLNQNLSKVNDIGVSSGYSDGNNVNNNHQHSERQFIGSG